MVSNVTLCTKECFVKTIYKVVLMLAVLVGSNERIVEADGVLSFCAVDWKRSCDAVPLSNPCDGLCAAAGDFCGYDVLFKPENYDTVYPAPFGTTGNYPLFIRKKTCGWMYDCECKPNGAGGLSCLETFFNPVPWKQSEYLAVGDECDGEEEP